MIDLRRRAQANKKGHPFSAMTVERYNSRFVVANNKVTATNDPTAHAEIEAIRKAGKKGFNFEDCIIICSGEPCPMCATAIAWAGMKEIYFMDPYKIANKKGYRLDQDVQRVNRLLNLGLRISPGARYVVVQTRRRDKKR